MTEDQLKKFLADNDESIKAAVKQKMIDKLLEDYRWDIGDQVSKIVNEFIATEIAPTIREHLQSEKGAIMEAAIKATAGISEAVATTMIAKAKENIDSYQFRSIMKALFE